MSVKFNLIDYCKYGRTTARIYVLLIGIICTYHSGHMEQPPIAH